MTQVETPELKELIIHTDALFDKPNFSMTEPDTLWKDKIVELEKANLKERISTIIFDMRVEQAKGLGFVQVTESDITHDLMGESHNTHSISEKNTLKYEWCYNHHTDKVELDQRTQALNTYDLVAKRTAWYLPPFKATEQWSVVGGPVSALKSKLPHNMVTRMNRLKKLKLFNCFQVFAPYNAFTEKKKDQQTMLVARISEFKSDGEKGYSMSGEKAGQQAFFFVGFWI